MKIVHTALTIASLLMLCSWGEKGHQKINSTAPQFFPSSLNNFKGWSVVLSEHGSDPDKRRRVDPTEEIKHYIDIDAYTDFVQTHKIVEGKNESIEKYSKAFIMKNGTLPWVTDSTYHLLVQQFKSKDWSKVVLQLIFGYYVGNGHLGGR